jgi:MoaA/NifB/PqqE/SkfB family radical SAM enzyme
MDLFDLGARLLSSRASGPLLELSGQLLYCGALRRQMVKIIDARLRTQLNKDDGVPASWRTILRQRLLIYRAILHTIDRVIERRILSPHVARTISKLWGRAICLSARTRSVTQPFYDEFGCDPPWFLVISPGHACNLKCTGCYANSGSGASQVDWTILDRIMTEAKQLWGVPLFVFSGGEPLLYRSRGKDLLDMVEKHDDSLFLMFTNGMQIDKDMAARLARLGNLTPALSVEGLRSRTDARRGMGVFDRVLAAMADLRQAGVPFGISVTVNRDNWEEILSDEFLDFFFDRQGAFYGFLFQYMPIGRNPDFNDMPTPQQAIQFWRRSWEVVAKRQRFLLDFWNHGPLVEGCIAAGRDRGYLYIDWNGKVMPCVFAPYAGADIYQIYSQGGNLNDAWAAPLFETIRRWQRDYGYGQDDLTTEGNWLHPCPFRDHYGTFREWIRIHQAEPEDEAAREALADAQYAQTMVAYGMAHKSLRQMIWEKEYLNGHRSRD